MAADQEGQGVGECFSHISQELCIPGRVTCARGLKFKDPKPPMTSGTISDHMSKKLHDDMYATTKKDGRKVK